MKCIAKCAATCILSLSYKEHVKVCDPFLLKVTTDTFFFLHPDKTSVQYIHSGGNRGIHFFLFLL